MYAPQKFALQLKRCSTWTFGQLKCILRSLDRALKWIMEQVYLLGVHIGEETDILAIRVMVNRQLHACERCFWFVLFLLTIAGAMVLSYTQIKRFLTSPSVISVDRYYNEWIGYLPAVTICYEDRVDGLKARDYIYKQWNVSHGDSDYFYLLNFISAVMSASARQYSQLAKFAEDERFDEIDLVDLINSVKQSFEQVLSAHDIDFEIEQLEVMTERGLCYAINSPLSHILMDTNSILQFDDLSSPLTCEFGREECFIKMGISKSAATIDVHSPFEVTAIDANDMVLALSHEIRASYKVLETVAAANLRDLAVEQRKCVFYDEEASNLKVYSRSLCLVRCRALMALEMCNCVPFFYKFVAGPSCNPAGFECLMDFKWPVWALHICKCPSTCTEIEYTVQTIRNSFRAIKSQTETLIDTSSFRAEVLPPKVRLRRDVVFSFEDLLVSFGGALALCLGFSLISLNQLAYVLTVHLLDSCGLFVKYIYKKSRRAHRIVQVRPMDRSQRANYNV